MLVKIKSLELLLKQYPDVINYDPSFPDLIWYTRKLNEALPEDRKINLKWEGTSGIWKRFETVFYISPQMIEKFLDPNDQPLVSSTTPEFLKKLNSFTEDLFITALLTNEPKIYLASQAIADPTKISFFANKYKALTYSFLLGRILDVEVKEYRKKHAVMTRPGRYFAKYGIKDTQKLEELTSYFRDYNFKLIKGEDIRKYYLGKNYTSFEETSLHESCMQHESCQEYFDFYVENLKMLVAFNNEGKIYGRALFWENIESAFTNEKINFLDRIYGSEIFQHSAKRYARSQGWYHKEKQNYCSHKYLIDPNGNRCRISLKYFTTNNYKFLPYMDTMCWQTSKFLNNYSSGRVLDGLDGNALTVCEDCGSFLEDDEIWRTGDNENLCETCYNELWTNCARCSDAILRDEASYLESEDSYYCSCCASCSLSECDFCNKLEHNFNLNSIADSTICQECYEENIEVPCPNCNIATPVQELEENQNHFCDKCLEEIKVQSKEELKIDVQPSTPSKEAEGIKIPDDWEPRCGSYSGHIFEPSENDS